MATTKELLEQYKNKRQKIEEMASPETIEKRHKGRSVDRQRKNRIFL